MRKLCILTVVISFFTLTSCGGNDDEKPIEQKKCSLSITTENGITTVRDLYAPSGEGSKGYKPDGQKGKFVKFDLDKGEITNSETDWDIAFRWSTILINGGKKGTYDSEPERTSSVSAYITEKSFNEVTSVNTDLFKQDEGVGKLAINDDVTSGKGVWSYSLQTHIVSAIPGRILVIKTSKGDYVKLKIMSFYNCAPKPNELKIADERFNYYTFAYGKVKK